MRQSIWMCLVMGAMLSTQLMAGVVFEVETTDHEQSPPKTSSSEIAIESPRLKMVVASGNGGREDGDMIWRGDQREMVIVDHENKSYIVMDAETTKSMARQVGQASAQLEEALKNVPEEQRAMIEQMMKNRMPQQVKKIPVTEIRQTSESKEINGYPCVKYIVNVDGREIRRLWVTDWDNIEGGDGAAKVFLEMSAFFSEMMEAVGQAAGGLWEGDGGKSVFAQLNEIDGFPIVTQEFADDGSLESESVLRSAKRRTLDPAEFEPPSGYKRRSMMPQ